jgi:hypothetical protein
MDRIADPQTYICAVEQSVEPAQLSMDPVYFAYCEKPSTVLSPEVEKPITTPAECFIKRRAVMKAQPEQKQ